MLVSPLNTKPVCPAVVVVVDPTPAVEEAFNNIQGTATCLPPVVAVAPVALVLLVLEVLEPTLPELPAPLTEMTAKSSRPEFGFTMLSLMVPIC